MGGKLLVLRSSAGSGKTYSLVYHFLKIALATPQASAYTRILAITFTNAAAAEMKERVMNRLREFSSSKNLQSGDTGLFRQLCSDLDLSPDELHLRSASVFNHMLHHYGQIGISTIDSFIHRLIRSFARDLRLNPDFSIETDQEDFVRQVSDRVLSSVGIDPVLTRYLEDFISERVDEESGWSAREEIERFASNLFREDTAEALTHGGPDDLQSYWSIRTRLNNEHSTLLQPLKEAAAAILQLLESHRVERVNLYYKGAGIIPPLEKIIQGEFKTVPGKRLLEEVAVKGWGRKENDAGIASVIRTLEPTLNEFVQRIGEWYESGVLKKLQLIELINQNIIGTGLLRHLNQAAQEIREEQNLLLISDFNEIVSRIIRDSPAPFIYERAGDRYHHVLFDEFQDTSKLQWQNFIPILENALSEANFNLIVGDGKQAIYRWRNGYVEQFIDLPDLEGDHDSHRKALFRNAFKLDHLAINYRSAREIIRFNNTMYEGLRSTLGRYDDVYESHAQQEKRNRTGYVQVSFVEGRSSKELLDPTLEQIRRAIEQAREDGYTHGDIVILTRKGSKEASPVAEFLHKNGIPVMTRDSFLLEHSSIVRWLMALLKYTTDPDDAFTRFDVIRSAPQAFKHLPSIDELVEHYVSGEGKKIEARTSSFLDAFFPGLLEGLTPSAHPLNLCRHVLEVCHILEDVHVEFLLDHINQLTNSRNYGLRDILSWWEEKHDTLCISSSAISDAVTIMTVHKSKGLQFPVVIYPRFDSRDVRRHAWVSPGNLVPELPRALVSWNPGSANLPEECTLENERSYLDDVNLCYVATTRAEEQLYMIIQIGEKNGGRLNRELRSVIGSMHTETITELSFGQREAAPEKGKPESGHILGISDTGNSAKLSFRFTAPRKDSESESLSARKYGELVHECLSLIVRTEDRDRAVARTTRRHRLDTEQEQRLSTEVDRILNHPNICGFFTSAGEVLNERSLMLDTGEIYRPDRILLYPDEHTIIDFKTGERKSAHERQVQFYMRELQRITGKPSRGYLLYTSDLSLISVEI